eukprot:767945-Hanusia_phi.AAC.16
MKGIPASKGTFFRCLLFVEFDSGYKEYIDIEQMRTTRPCFIEDALQAHRGIQGSGCQTVIANRLPWIGQC